MAHDEPAPDKETTYREIRDRLADRRQVAILWDAEDVGAVRPDLDAEQAWQVLQRAEHQHDGDRGLTWETIAAAAQALFPGPEAGLRADGPPNVAGDVYAALMTRLESAADAFTRLARTPEQAAVAEQFAAFVAGDAHDSLKYLTGLAVATDRPDAAPDLPDEIGLGWSVEDVRDLRPDLNDDQCRQVLHQVALRHDASVGITWDTIEDAADDLFPPAPRPSPGPGATERERLDAWERFRDVDGSGLTRAERDLYDHELVGGRSTAYQLWTPEGAPGDFPAGYAVAAAFPAADAENAADLARERFFDLESGSILTDGRGRTYRFDGDRFQEFTPAPGATGSVPSVADILADSRRYLDPEHAHGPGPEPGRGRSR